MVLDHRKHALSGGTTILARPLDANDIVALYAAIPMGSLYETDEEAGISQLVQSVLPRGTARRSADAFQDRLAELGAELDTSAGTDMGSVTLKATAETWEPAAELFLEALTEPAFAEDEVASEVEQTLGALEAREDELMNRALDLFREVFYGEHPYHKPAIGYRETVREIDRDQVVAAAHRFYRPTPPVVTAVGRFDTVRLLSMFESTLGQLPIGPPMTRPPPPEPGGGARRLALDRDAAYLVYGFPAPDYMHPDYPVARLIDAVLGGSMSSRLFIELREKRSLAYQVSTFYSDRVDGSFLAGYIVTDPDRVEEAAHGLAAEFDRIVTEPIGDDELSAAKHYLRGRFLLGAETNMSQASRLAAYEVYGLGHDFGDKWVAEIQSVTAEQVRAVARRWLTGSPTCAWIVRTGTPEFEL
jgi:zinc protease